MTYIRESDNCYPNKLNILDYNGHAMYIPRVDALSRKYRCNECDIGRSLQTTKRLNVALRLMNAFVIIQPHIKQY